MKNDRDQRVIDNQMQAWLPVNQTLNLSFESCSYCVAPNRPIERICSGSFDILDKSSNDISRTWIRATSNVCCRSVSDYHDCISTNLVSGLRHFVGTEEPLADLRTSNNRHKERPQTPIPSCNDEYIVVHNQKHTNCYSCNLLHNGPRYYY